MWQTPNILVWWRHCVEWPFWIQPSICRSPICMAGRCMAIAFHTTWHPIWRCRFMLLRIQLRTCTKYCSLVYAGFAVSLNDLLFYTVICCLYFYDFNKYTASYFRFFLLRFKTYLNFVNNLFVFTWWIFQSVLLIITQFW